MSHSPSELSISPRVTSDTSYVVYAPDWIPCWPFCHQERGPTDSAGSKTLTRKAHDTALPEQGASRFNFRICPRSDWSSLNVYISLPSTGTNSGESAASAVGGETCMILQRRPLIK